MVCFDEGHEIWVVRIAKVWGVIVLNKNALVLQTDDGYAIAVVVRKRAEAETEG